MKVTRMYTKTGELPSTDTILALAYQLRKCLRGAGFITEVTFGDSRSNMKIGRGRSFKIDTLMLPKNKDYGPHGRTTKSGYKLTDVPTWEQRVKFNSIVNSCFDAAGIDCKIVSGEYLIRCDRTGPVTYFGAPEGRALEIAQGVR